MRRPKVTPAIRQAQPAADGYLPGLAHREPGEATPVAVTEATRAGWWVRTSAAQVTDVAGRYSGFRHQLMRGGRVMQTGVGADAGRTFQLQADFFNTRSRPLTSGINAKDETFVSTHPSPAPTSMVEALCPETENKKYE